MHLCIMTAIVFHCTPAPVSISETRQILHLLTWLSRSRYNQLGWRFFFEGLRAWYPQHAQSFFLLLSQAFIPGDPD